MEVVTQPQTTVVDVQSSGISWAAIAAGAVASVAVTLLLVALGAGLGLSSVSPWSGSGVSATTFKIGTGIYLCCVAVMGSAIGGYLAARLRTRWSGGLHTNEVYFRDTAHGFITWAFATLISAAVLGSVTTRIASGTAEGASAGAAQAAQNVNPSQIYVDQLFRTDAAAPAAAGAAPATPAAGGANNPRAEVLRLWTSSFRNGGELSPSDRAYVARVVAARTGMSQADADKRVNDVIVEAKTAADNARKAAAAFSFWLAASLLLGAFAASLAAVEGGQLRDGTWNDRVLTPRTL